MFTGIIQDIGIIKSLRKSGDWMLEIGTALDLDKTAIGASIACSGCCLTVIGKSKGSFSVQVSAETLSKTCIGDWSVGSQINLEPALKMSDELGGHIVSGHVDGLARISAIKPEGDSHRIEVVIPEGLERLIAAKGSVALDGVSLTVNEVGKAHFGVNVIPHTWLHTTLGQKKEGDKLHIEVDMLARYVARMLGRDEGGRL